MTPEERQDVAKRLMGMQKMLKDVCDACEAQADVCDTAGVKRLSFAVHMVREALIVYSRELNRYAISYMNGDSTPEEMDIFQ